jgi:glucose/arabinose dehydrogenase
MYASRLLPVLVSFGLCMGMISSAAPPGALLRQKIIVPASMQTDAFGSDQYVSLPPGFRISVWARATNARFLAVASNGDVFVSQPSLGQVSILRPDPNGGDPAAFVYVSGLNGPQGLAFNTVAGVTWLYIGEDDQIDRYVYHVGDTSAPASKQVLVTNLMGTGQHPYKDITIGPDQSVYWGFGSSGNVTPEDTQALPELACVYKMNPDGSGLQLFASGLRNPEGLAFLPGTNTLWAAVNNRDDIPYPYRDSTGNYGQVVTS